MRLRKSMPAALRTFIAEYEAGLPNGLVDDYRYEFRLRVVNELAPRDPEASAFQFTRYDDLSDEQKASVEELGRKGLVIVREQKRGVINLELLKPRQVIRDVAAELPFAFHMGHFIKAWQILKVRPPGDSTSPSEPTKSIATTTSCTTTTATLQLTSRNWCEN
jgi:hypothetical protein